MKKYLFAISFLFVEMAAAVPPDTHVVTMLPIGTKILLSKSIAIYARTTSRILGSVPSGEACWFKLDDSYYSEEERIIPWETVFTISHVQSALGKIYLNEPDKPEISIFCLKGFVTIGELKHALEGTARIVVPAGEILNFQNYGGRRTRSAEPRFLEK